MTQTWTLRQVAEACAQAGGKLPLPTQPQDGSAFAEPWQAQVFAMTLALHQRGLFSWTEWAGALATQIGAAAARGEPDDGSTYYRHWADALESLLIGRGVTTADQLHDLEHAWEAAAARTPHGQPIALGPGDLSLLG